MPDKVTSMDEFRFKKEMENIEIPNWVKFALLSGIATTLGIAAKALLDEATKFEGTK